MSGKIYTIDEIKSILDEILKNMPVYSVILFGSYAKNSATKYSDLDFVIDTRENLMGFKRNYYRRRKRRKGIDG